MSDVQTVYQIPGPRGNAGQDGADGTDGENAWTTTTGGFNMPAEGASVTVAVLSSDWVSVGQMVHLSGAGYFESEAADALQITIKNMRDTAAGMYLVNVAAGTAIASGKRVSPAGLQGPAGA
jgi:hypothetical protein